MATATSKPTAAWALDELMTTTRGLPSRLLVWGPPGVGKTITAAHAPGAFFPLFADETGVETLMDAGLLSGVQHSGRPVDSWDMLLSIIETLTSKDHKLRTLIIDTAGSAEKLCYAAVCQREFKGQWGEQGFEGYRRGYRTSQADWAMFLDKLDRLRAANKMGILFLAHAKVATFKNPEGPDYDRYVPDMEKETWQQTSKWLDAVLFANFVTEVLEEKGKRGKGRGGGERVMSTTYTASYEAKNRFGLPDEIPMGGSGKEAWGNLSNAIKTARQSNNKER